MDYASLEKERLELYASYKKQRNIGILIIVVGIALVFLGFSVPKVRFFLYIGMGVFVVGLIFLAAASSKSKTYNKRNKPKIIDEMLNELYPGSTYNMNGGIPLQEIFSSGLITKKPDRYHLEDLINGSYEGVKFRTCDVKLEEKRETRDSKGNRHVQWITYFQGRWYEFQFEKNLNQTIRIKEKALFKEMNVKGLTKCEVESIDFTEKFFCYASNPEGLFYVLTPVIIEKITQMEKMHKGKIMFAFIDDKLYIGINDSKNYLEINIKTPVTEESMKSYRGQISILGAVIKEFGLDTNKYKNQNY